MITSHMVSHTVGPNAELYLWWRASPSHTGEIGSLPIFGKELMHDEDLLAMLGPTEVLPQLPTLIF